MTERTVGIVGAGQIVRDIHLPVLLGLPGVRVAWIADAAPERARALGRDYGIHAVAGAASPGQLPPADVALLGIPAHAREGYLRAFAERGTAVLAEKPFAIGAHDHERFAALFPEHRLACGYMRRFYRSTTILRRTVAARPFGALLALGVAEGGRAAKSGFDTTFQDRASAHGGGVLWAIGCHLLDLALHLTDASAFEIVSKDVVFDADTDREATATLDLQGVPTRFCVSWLGPQEDRVTLEFERASVSAGLSPDSAVLAMLRDGSRLALGLDAEERLAATTSYQAFHLEWREFLDGVERGTPSRISASTSLLTTRLVDALLAREPA